MTIKFYLVGGAVRDIVLGLEPRDYDYCVVGASQQWFIENGFTQVGQDFPVFLHPVTAEEYAMARRERLGEGHTFELSVDNVSIEEDLKRRDYTMNAMALEVDYRLDGVCSIKNKSAIIDPYAGQRHLKARELVHTSEHFVEDPLRILRGARLAAKYKLQISPETKELCHHMIDQQMLARITQPRIFLEIKKSFGYAHTSEFIENLLALRVNEYVEYLNITNLRDRLAAVEFLEQQLNNEEIEALSSQIKLPDIALLKFALLFHTRDIEFLKKNHIPPSFYECCSILSKYQHTVRQYLKSSTNERLRFLLATKALHSSDLPQQYLWLGAMLEQNLAIFTDSREQMQLDIQALKAIDYESIRHSSALADIRTNIEEAQLSALSQLKREEPQRAKISSRK